MCRSVAQTWCPACLSSLVHHWSFSIKPDPQRFTIVWDNAGIHEDDEVVLRGASGRFILIYLPTDSP